MAPRAMGKCTGCGLPCARYKGIADICLRCWENRAPPVGYAAEGASIARRAAALNALGFTDAQIARHLRISLRSVEAALAMPASRLRPGLKKAAG